MEKPFNFKFKPFKLTNWWLQPDKFDAYTCHWKHKHTIVTTLQGCSKVATTSKFPHREGI